MNRTLLANWKIFLTMKEFIKSINTPFVSCKPAMSPNKRSLTSSFLKVGKNVSELTIEWPI